MEYYSALKGRENLTYATTSVNLKILCSVKEDNHKRTNRILRTCGTWGSQSDRDRRMAVARGSREWRVNKDISCADAKVLEYGC